VKAAEVEDGNADGADFSADFSADAADQDREGRERSLSGSINLVSFIRVDPR
jgi:hypothetical protein